MPNHDPGYKSLFSHPELVRDLLLGFVHEPWVAEVDLATLERVNGSYVSDDLRSREDDVVWRVRFRDRWLYLYLLVEFQSTMCRYMAVRLQTYLGLLAQDLIRGYQLPESGLLPPIFPIVLYNGSRRWTAPLELAELFEEVPAGLESYRPSLRYLLIDEGRLSESELTPLRNLAAALFRLENSRTPEDIHRLVGTLREWIGHPDQTQLRRAFAVWIRRVLLVNRLPGIELPEVNDLNEVDAMLAERVREWTLDWKQQGLEEGRMEGRMEGEKEGEKRGMLKGLQQGEATLLRRQLTRRFGPLPGWAEQRLAVAIPEQLEPWADRVLDAGSLEEVVGAAPSEVEPPAH